MYYRTIECFYFKNKDNIAMKANRFTKETIKDFGIFDRDFPAFTTGDEIEVSQWIVEVEKDKKNKEVIRKRVQAFKGIVISQGNSGISRNFTVRSISANSVAVEKIFPYYSKTIDAIKVITKANVRRSKLYFLRNIESTKARKAVLKRKKITK